MSEAFSAHPDASSVNLACFKVKGQIYALEVAQVREIVRPMEVTPLPNAPRLIEGVIDLRGIVIPVVDLGRVLNQDRVDHDMHSRIVVLEHEGLVLGLVVDAATDVLSIGTDCLGDVPDLASHAGYSAVRHVVRRTGEAPVMVLSLESILEDVYRSALPVRNASEEGA